jgi:hypothetical protein
VPVIPRLRAIRQQASTSRRASGSGKSTVEPSGIERATIGATARLLSAIAGPWLAADHLTVWLVEVTAARS